MLLLCVLAAVMVLLWACALWRTKENMIMLDVAPVLYVLYHDAASRSIALSVFATVPGTQFLRVPRSKYFEAAAFRHLDADRGWERAKYVGTVPYSIAHKQRLASFDLPRLLRAAGDADVVTFFSASRHGLVAHANRFHSNFVRVWTALLTRMGFTREEATSSHIPFYPCNAWMAKPAWMRRYLKFVLRAMQLMDEDVVLAPLCDLNSDYPGKLPEAELRALTGKPYYTLHPFITERLPCFFFWRYGAVVRGGNVAEATFDY